MKYTKHITVSTYRSRGNFEVIVSNDGTYGKDYKEASIFFKDGHMYYSITDGYEWLQPVKRINDNLKSAINIVAGKIAPTPWYCK